MPVPGVTIEWVDQSQINSEITPPEEDTVDRPIFMTVITADKGPEEWKHKVYGEDFFKYYGRTPSFKRHGQPLLQAANIINAGGYLTVKRVCADDSTLANVVVSAKITQGTEQDTDKSGVPLWDWVDSASSTTGTVANPTMPTPGTMSIPSTATVTGPHTVACTNVSYVLSSLPGMVGCVKMSTYVSLAKSGYTKVPVGNNNIYPLFIITDNGRGESNKRIRIYPDSTVSHPTVYSRYFVEVSENGEVLETIPFTLNPDIIEKEHNMSLQNAILTNSYQVRCKFFDDIYEDFIENVNFLTGTTNFDRKDPLFGIDLSGKAIKHYNTDGATMLSPLIGFPLPNGSNGNFTDSPAQLAKGASGAMNVVDVVMKKAFSGSINSDLDDGDDIYDLDNNRVDCIFDANYHQEVKRSIESLANFREDLVYFRDFGTEVNGLTMVQLIDTYGSHSRFCASYMNSYDIYDPYTRKQITVTVTYDLARLFVKHFINGRVRPFCGQKYDIVIPSDTFVDGTLNFSPKRTPSEDQRKTFDTLRINYLSYYDGNILTMNTEYTSQTELTQLSWVNNVLAVQELIKAIRALCPKIRYSFLDGDDLVKYKKDVQNMVIDRYADRFQSCTINYVTNANYDSNKIIYATIELKFRNFVQTEVFKIIALQS